MFLHKLMEGQGLAGRHPVLDGHVISYTPDDAEIVHGTPLPSYFHAIRAALILLRLIPDDKTALAHMSHWATTHPDEKVREELRQQLEQQEHRP